MIILVYGDDESEIEVDEAIDFEFSPNESFVILHGKNKKRLRAFTTNDLVRIEKEI